MAASDIGIFGVPLPIVLVLGAAIVAGAAGEHVQSVLLMILAALLHIAYELRQLRMAVSEFIDGRPE